MATTTENNASPTTNTSTALHPPNTTAPQYTGLTGKINRLFRAIRTIKPEIATLLTAFN